MSALGDRMRAAGTAARLKFLRVLNRWTVALLGGVLIANQLYSGVIGGWFNKLPPYLGIPLLIVFGATVEYASRQPKP